MPTSAPGSSPPAPRPARRRRAARFHADRTAGRDRHHRAVGRRGQPGPARRRRSAARGRRRAPDGAARNRRVPRRACSGLAVRLACRRPTPKRRRAAVPLRRPAGAATRTAHALARPARERAEVGGRTTLVLGPGRDPAAAAHRAAPGRPRLELATDGLGPFAVADDGARRHDAAARAASRCSRCWWHWPWWRIALGAGLRAAGALTDNAERLADVIAAQWCADNQLAGLRLTRRSRRGRRRLQLRTARPQLPRRDAGRRTPVRGTSGASTPASATTGGRLVRLSTLSTVLTTSASAPAAPQARLHPGGGAGGAVDPGRASVLSWQGLDGMLRARDVSHALLDRSMRLATVVTQWEQDLAPCTTAGVVPALAFDGRRCA